MRPKRKRKYTFKRERCSPSSENNFTCYKSKSLYKLKTNWNKTFPKKKIKAKTKKAIWKQLKKNMNTVCSKESCWLKQHFIKNKLNNELINNTFAPKAPITWKKNSREWLNNLDIGNVMKQYEEKYKDFRFIGPTPIDYDYLKSDNRFYFAENLDSSFKELFENEYIRGVLKGYTGFKNPKGLLLAARLDFKNGNIGSGGGWHRDSPFSHQFKAVCYLSNVDEKSGPFQIFKKTHLILNIFKLFVMNFFKLDKYRYTNKEAENFKKATGSLPTSFLGDEGKLAFIDTKALHRGKPIAAGSRYVIFWYFWENNIPNHFEKYR